MPIGSDRVPFKNGGGGFNQTWNQTRCKPGDKPGTNLGQTWDANLGHKPGTQTWDKPGDRHCLVGRVKESWGQAQSDLTANQTKEFKRVSCVRLTLGPAGWPIGFLTVVDVSEATSPATITQIELAGYRPYGVASDEHIVTIANGTEGLRIIDASDPKSPVEIGNLPTTNVVDVTVRGSYAYLAEKSGLRIANVSNFTQPEQVAMLKTSGPCLDVSIEGDQALAATGENGIDIVDISNPFAPALRATIPVSPAVSVSLNDGIAAVGAAGAGVCLIDTTKPIDTPIQSLDISANGACTLFQGELLYVSDMAIGRGPYGLGSRTTLRIYKVKRTRS